MKHFRTLLVLAAVVSIMIVGLAAFGAGAADHLEAPLVQEDGRLDINDLYAFKDGDYTALIMTVNPLAGVANPTTLISAPYNLNYWIDNDGDAVADLQLFLRARRPNHRGVQRIALYLDDLETGERRRIGTGLSGRDNRIRGGGMFTTGLYDDPFFFDLQAFRDTLGGGSRAFCDSNAVDFFAGLNVTAWVVKIPTVMLTDGSPNIGVWATTDRGTGNRIDRMGRPAIATVFIDSADRDAFNMTNPVDDYAMWGDDVAGVLMALGGYDQATADSIAAILLPDILTIDTSSDAGFLNGRALADDVIDAELGIVTNGAIPGDCIDANDKPFSATFPYLAAPHS